MDINKLKYMIRKKQTISEIAEALEVTEAEVIGTAMKLKEEGALIDYIDGKLVKMKKPIINGGVYEIPTTAGVVKFGLYQIPIFVTRVIG